MHARQFVQLLMCGACLVAAAPAFAVPEIEVTQDLVFGTYVMRGDNAGAGVVITPLGQRIPDAAFIPVDGVVQNGIIQMRGFDPDADLLITVTFNDNDPLSVACGAGFTVDNFTTDVVGGTVHTNGVGDAQIAFGARLQSTGGSYNNNNCSEPLPVSVVLDN